MQKQRPKYLDITKIRLPVPGLVSIFHRVSGVILFLVLPFLLYLLHGSLSKEQFFDTYRMIVAYPLVKLILIVLLWAYLHHFCAGIRFLFLDVHEGLELPTARASAKAVFIISILLTIIIGVIVW